ncbi:hypothetical protein Hanom_Chr02g00100121 [Helianthus anomalus]
MHHPNGYKLVAGTPQFHAGQPHHCPKPSKVVPNWWRPPPLFLLDGDFLEIF